MADPTAPAAARVMAMLHHRTGAIGSGDSIAEPLVGASMYHLPDEPAPDRTYGRTANPTVQAAEARLSLLEDAPALLFPSGMAAYSALALAALKAGDRVLMLSDGYYAARNLVTEVLGGFGVTLTTLPAAEIGAAPLDGVRMVLIETPTNPGLEVIDIAGLAARCRAAGCLLAVDNTVATALLQRPLDLGADVVVVSDTKAAAGHSDLLLGHVASRDAGLMERVHGVRTLGGAIPGPFEAWLLIRGLETLELRLSRMCASADAVAEALRGAPASRLRVTTPAPHAQASHGGFLIGADFADRATGERFLAAAGCFVPATSFGGVHSSADRRARWGDDVSDGFLRLSIGIEPRAQLLTAVEKGLAAL